jgi:prephenate dehydrogenase
VVIATPLQEMRLVLAQLGRLTDGSKTLATDVGSTKAAVCAWAAELLSDRRQFLGGHPMTGKTETGLKAADKDLFKGSPWIFTPYEGQDLKPFQDWMKLVESLGASPIVMTPEEHDRRVALVSHLAFVASAAYVASVKASPDWADAVRIAGPGFRDITRLAGGDPDLYTGIARTNRENLLAAVKRLETELAKFRRHLEADDPRIWELFEETKRVHDQWTK